MPLTNQAKNEMLTDFIGEAVFASLHTAAPGQSGANEISGGNYARQAVTWNTPTAGSVSASNVPEIPLDAGVTASFVGFFDAATGGNFYAFQDVTDEMLSNDGVARITPITISLPG